MTISTDQRLIAPTTRVVGSAARHLFEIVFSAAAAGEISINLQCKTSDPGKSE